MVIHTHFAQLNYDLHVFDIVQSYQSDLVHFCEVLRPFLYLFCMVELWFECFEYYPCIQMWQYMLFCGVGTKPVAHLMHYHLLQWEVAKVKPLMNSDITLTVLNLHQETPKGATTKIQVKRYKRDKTVSDIPMER